MTLSPSVLRSWDKDIYRAFRPEVSHSQVVTTKPAKGGIMFVTRSSIPAVNAGRDRTVKYSYGKVRTNRVPIPLDRYVYSAIELNELDLVQQAVSVKSEQTTLMGQEIAIQIDTDVYGIIADGAGTAISAKTIGFASGDTDIYNFLLDIEDQFDELNIPKSDRFAVLPTFGVNGLREGGGDFVSYGTQPNIKRLRGEPVGEAAGFKLIPSNTIPKSGTARTALFMHKSAVAKASDWDMTKEMTDKDYPQVSFMSKTMNYACEVLDSGRIMKCQMTKGTFG